MRQIVRRADFPLPPSTIKDLQKKGLFPKYFHIGQRTVGLFADEWDRVMSLRAGGGTDEQVRHLVDRIHTERLQAAGNLLAEIV